jgi:hypothetical protein
MRDIGVNKVVDLVINRLLTLISPYGDYWLVTLLVAESDDT